MGKKLRRDLGDRQQRMIQSAAGNLYEELSGGPLTERQRYEVACDMDVRSGSRDLSEATLISWRDASLLAVSVRLHGWLNSNGSTKITLSDVEHMLRTKAMR